MLKMPRKTEGAGGGRKRRLPITVSEEKEKLVPHVIPAQKRKQLKHEYSEESIKLMVFCFSIINVTFI